jgi:hypothetical protein
MPSLITILHEYWNNKCIGRNRRHGSSLETDTALERRPLEKHRWPPLAFCERLPFRL